MFTEALKWSLKCPPDQKAKSIAGLPGRCVCCRLRWSPDRGRERLHRKDVHRPGAHLHSQAAAAADALHLLGNANLGHLHFKLVPRTRWIKAYWKVGNKWGLTERERETLITHRMQSVCRFVVGLYAQQRPAWTGPSVQSPTTTECGLSDPITAWYSVCLCIHTGV